MFINDKRPKEQQKILGKLREGDFFVYENELYIIQYVDDVYYAYNLSDEYSTEFPEGCEVQPVEVHIEIIRNK